MKGIVLAFALLVAVPVVVVAQPPNAYVVLASDANHATYEVFGSGFTPFNLWVWWFPSASGLKTALYEVTFPANVIAATVTTNPNINLFACEFMPPGGACAAFNDCQTDWVWSHRVTCYLTSAAPSFITIGPWEGEEQFVVNNCSCCYPIEAVTVFNSFALNQPAVISVESLTWGGIKSLYR